MILRPLAQHERNEEDAGLLHKEGLDCDGRRWRVTWVQDEKDDMLLATAQTATEVTRLPVAWSTLADTMPLTKTSSPVCLISPYLEYQGSESTSGNQRTKVTFASTDGEEAGEAEEEQAELVVALAGLAYQMVLMCCDSHVLRPAPRILHAQVPPPLAWDPFLSWTAVSPPITTSEQRNALICASWRRMQGAIDTRPAACIADAFSAFAEGGADLDDVTAFLRHLLSTAKEPGRLPGLPVIATASPRIDSILDEAGRCASIGITWPGSGVLAIAMPLLKGVACRRLKCKHTLGCVWWRKQRISHLPQAMGPCIVSALARHAQAGASKARTVGGEAAPLEASRAPNLIVISRDGAMWRDAAGRVCCVTNGLYFEQTWTSWSFRPEGRWRSVWAKLWARLFS